MVLSYLFIIAFLVAADQFSKQVIVTYLPLNDKREIISNFFYLTNVRNNGAAWSMLEGKQLLFIIITIGAILLFSYLLFKKNNITKLEIISYLLIIGGAIGNLIDRVINNYVIDFLDFYIFGYDFPVFNLADCFLTVGVFLYIVAAILESKSAKH